MNKILLLFSLITVLISCSKDDDSPAPSPMLPDINPPAPMEGCYYDNYDDYGDFTSDLSIKLLSNLPFEKKIFDIWGFKHKPSGIEYALVGYGFEDVSLDNNGLYIVEVSNPSSPKLISTVTNVGGWDIKTYDNYAYTVNGVHEAAGKIIDLEDPSNPKIVGDFPGSHNIFITNDGLLITSDPEVKIYDLKNDPANPELLWSDEKTGSHEAVVLNNILYDFHGKEGTNIYDISDPSDPKKISTIRSGLIYYHHSGWVNEEETILIIDDERPGGSAQLGHDFTIWDISDKTNPKLLSKFRDLQSTLHNVHLVNNKAHFSYYSAGYRVFNIEDPECPTLIYEYDTDPDVTGKGWFLGAFGVYGLSETGNIYISDVNNGLFIFGEN